MARPTKYNTACAARIIEGLKEGMTRRGACGYAGISEDTFTRWLKRFAGFAEQIARAEHEAEAKFTLVIAKAAFGHEEVVERKTEKPFQLSDGSWITLTETVVTRKFVFDWRAAREVLKRRFREDWSDNAHVDVDREIAGLLDVLEQRKHEEVMELFTSFHVAMQKHVTDPSTLSALQHEFDALFR